jgi:hypothetical protein
MAGVNFHLLVGALHLDGPPMGGESQAAIECRDFGFQHMGLVLGPGKPGCHQYQNGPEHPKHCLP